MEKFSITRRIEIDAAHRVPLHGSGCRALHGHRYVIYAKCTGTLQHGGEQDGMILDFGFLKRSMMTIIHNYCDHGLVLQHTDPLIEVLSAGVAQRLKGLPLHKPDEYFSDSTEWERGLKFYVIPDAPTAENLARHWFLLLQPEVNQISGGQAELVKVTVFETPNCKATFPE